MKPYPTKFRQPSRTASLTMRDAESSWNDSLRNPAKSMTSTSRIARGGEFRERLLGEESVIVEAHRRHALERGLDQLVGGRGQQIQGTEHARRGHAARALEHAPQRREMLGDRLLPARVRIRHR